MNFRVRLVLLILCILPNLALAAPLYVVVSDNLRGVTFSAAEIRRILLGEMAVVKNARIHLIYPSYSSPEIDTLSQFVGKGKGFRNLKSYWSKMIFTGQATPPSTASSEAELKSMIAQDNSIGVSTVSTGLNVVFTING